MKKVKKKSACNDVLPNLPFIILFIFPLILEEVQKPTYGLLNGKQQSAEGLHLSWLIKKDIFCGRQ